MHVINSGFVLYHQRNANIFIIYRTIVYINSKIYRPKLTLLFYLFDIRQFYKNMRYILYQLQYYSNFSICANHPRIYNSPQNYTS